MRVVWDEPKRQLNLTKHGLDFSTFENGSDFERAIERVAEPDRNGRRRVLLIGVLERRLVVAAVLSPLGTEAVSLISLRPASRNERKYYAQA